MTKAKADRCPLQHQRRWAAAFGVSALLILASSGTIWGVLASGLLLTLLVAALIAIRAPRTTHP